MTHTRHDVKQIFGRALEMETAESRAAYLDEACGKDAGLRAEVEELLAAIDRAGDFMHRPAGLATEALTPRPAPSAEGPGSVIGPYKLLQQIGEGGMGVVFMAEQTQPVQRKVALKIIIPGMDSRQVIARFEAERQALAMMDHQNIARVLDAGTTEGGRPYFVMELVHGVPITKFCDERKLTPRERLELFIPVCQAIQHAHQKGIIHRDIKPSNILVTMYDDKPVPKVIDFGVAKAVEQRLTEKTMFTQFGALIGTLEYMSPEQAEMNAFGVDTRSDIYSLGVMLYELLTGTTPLERQRLHQAALSEMVRLIKEEEAQRPSVRLSSSNLLPKIAAARNTEPTQLSRLVRGEIDWIVMKCLDKDRSRRYESASGLARDIQRHLTDEPVEACPPSASYRLRKFAHRYRTPLRIACAFALLLVAGVVVSAWQAIRATMAETAARNSEGVAQAQKREADEAKGKAEQQRDELRRLNYIADMNLAQNAWDSNNLVRARELLDQHRPGPGGDDLRRFEWHYLDRLFHSSLLTVKAHVGLTASVAITPDGKRLFSSGRSRARNSFVISADLPGEIKSWDMKTGEQIPLHLDGVDERVVKVALSADGSRLAAACGLAGVRVWTLGAGQYFELTGRSKDKYTAVNISPDGSRVAALSVFDSEDANSDKSLWQIKVWDLASRKEILTIPNLPVGWTHAPDFSPDGKSLAFVSYLDRRVRVVDAQTGKEVFQYDTGDGFVTHAVFSPDGKSLAACGEFGVYIWDVATHKKRITCRSVANLATSAAFSPDSKKIATGSLEGIIEVWDADSARKISEFKGHAGETRMLTFSRDGSSLVSAGADGTFRVWDVAGRAEAIPFLNEPTRIGTAQFSPDGKIILVEVIDDKRHRLLDATTGKWRGEPIEIEQMSDHPYDWTSDGKRLVYISAKKTISVLDVTSGKPVHSFPVDCDGAAVVTVGPDGKRFFHSTPERTIKARDAESGAEQRAFHGLAERVHNITVSPDGSHLAGADDAGTVKVWEVETGRETTSFHINDMYIFRLRFSPDGKKLFIVGNNSIFFSGEARVWDVEAGRELVQLRGHTLLVMDIIPSPDGQRLVTCSSDRTVRVWDARTGQEILSLKGHTLPVESIRFSSDGRRLSSVSLDRTVRVWDGTPLSD